MHIAVSAASAAQTSSENNKCQYSRNRLLSLVYGDCGVWNGQLQPPTWNMSITLHALCNIDKNKDIIQLQNIST